MFEGVGVDVVWEAVVLGEYSTTNSVVVCGWFGCGFVTVFGSMATLISELLRSASNSPCPSVGDLITSHLFDLNWLR